MPSLPTGTVTFLLSDVEGSTSLWEQAPELMRVALSRHDALFEAAILEHGGAHIRPRGEGDSRFAVFPGAADALAAALAVQRWHAEYFLAHAETAELGMRGSEQVAWMLRLQADQDNLRAALEWGLSLDGDRWWIAWTLHVLGRTAYFDGDAETARSLGLESLAVAREIGDDCLVAWAQHLLALAADIAEDFQGTRRHFEESLTIRRRLDFREGISLVLSLLGLLEFREGSYATSRALLIESLDAQRELNAGWVVGNTLATLAALAVALEQPERGARISGAVSAMSDAVSIRPIPIVEVIYRPALDQVCKALGEAAVSAEQQVGRRMSMDDIIAEVLAIDIADQPVISSHTVERHITHVYQKTGARGRAEATAYALRHSLT